MPKALPVDHEKIKMVALQIGVREAARRFELKEATVQAWSDREGWFAQKAEVQEIVNKHIEEMGMQPVATKTPSEAILESKVQSKLSLAFAVEKTAKVLEDQPDEHRIKSSGALLNTANAWAKVHTSDNVAPSTAIQINLSGIKFATEDQV